MSIEIVDLLDSATEIALGLNDIVKILAEETKAEQEFTQRTVAKIRSRHPDFNAVVVHSAYRQTFTGSVTQAHYELALHGTRTQGYDIFTFKSGEFWLDGDGGYQNWCISGNYVSDGHHITFSDPSPPPPPPPPPPAAPTDGVFLVNSVLGDQKSSGFAYYSNINNSEGNQPDEYIDILTGGCVIWEGNAFSGTFKNGTTFFVIVDLDGQSTPQDGACGGAHSNSRNMTVYKANFAVLYTVGGWQVHAVYYCQ